MYSGFLNVLKPPGMTSHDLVAVLRKVLQQKRIGHSGTLDPNASGVMVIALGPATRLLEYLDSGIKEYIGLVRLGIDTDTYDADGVITSQYPAVTCTMDQLHSVAASLVGRQMQKPPLVSAVRVGGKRLYEYARSGTKVEPPLREVIIHELKVAPLAHKRLYGISDLVRMWVRCSKGTYVRSLAYDLGHGVGSGAHLATLLRTESDGFRISDGLTIEEITQLSAEGRVTECLIRPADALRFPAIQLDSLSARRVANGNLIDFPAESVQNEYFSLIYEGNLIAVAQYRSNSGHSYLQAVKVLTNELHSY